MGGKEVRGSSRRRAVDAQDGGAVRGKEEAAEWSCKCREEVRSLLWKMIRYHACDFP